MLRVATVRSTTDTHYRHTLQTHTTDTHYRHTLPTHTTDTHYSHTLQTHTTDTHYRHTLQTHTTDTHYRHTLQTHTTDTHYRHTLQTHFSSFNVHGSVHHINILFHIIPTRYTIHRVHFYLTFVYMFWALLSPIVRSTKQL